MGCFSHKSKKVVPIVIMHKKVDLGGTDIYSVAHGAPTAKEKLTLKDKERLLTLT